MEDESLVPVPAGEKMTIVAAAFVYDTNNNKIHSPYSNEIIIDNTGAIPYNSYTEDSFHLTCFEANTSNVVSNVKDGDMIDCKISFETLASTPVDSFEYTLSYSNGGLKLKNTNFNADVFSNSTANDGNYKHTLITPTSVSSSGIIKFTFKVIDVEFDGVGLMVGIDNIKFKSGDNYYYTNNSSYANMTGKIN